MKIGVRNPPAGKLTYHQLLQAVDLAYRCPEFFALGDSSVDSRELVKKGMPKETHDSVLDGLLGQFGANWRSLVAGGQLGRALNAAVHDRYAKGERPPAFCSQALAKNNFGHLTQALRDVSNLQLPGSAASARNMQAPSQRVQKAVSFTFTKENSFVVRGVKYREGFVVVEDNVQVVNDRRILSLPYSSFNDSQCSTPLKELMALLGNTDPDLLKVDVTVPVKVASSSKSSPQSMTKSSPSERSNVAADHSQGLPLRGQPLTGQHNTDTHFELYVYVGAGKVDSLRILKDPENAAKMTLEMSGSNKQAFLDEDVDIGGETIRLRRRAFALLEDLQAAADSNGEALVGYPGVLKAIVGVANAASLRKELRGAAASFLQSLGRDVKSEKALPEVLWSGAGPAEGAGSAASEARAVSGSLEPCQMVGATLGGKGGSGGESEGASVQREETCES